ncbi:MAG: flagellar hook assembly protein FlgD [Alphaproteobacteria bacterium]
MDITSISSAASLIDPVNLADDAGVSLGSDLDTFLSLLITQLQNQDPLSPMDTTEFTSQLVSFSQVEQSITANKNLEQVIALSQGSFNTAALGYIGMTVEATGNDVPYNGEPLQLYYTLPVEAEETLLTVFDATGQVVFQTAGENGKGRHGYVWDGKDTLGNPVDPGTYNVQVLGTDEDGEPLSGDVSYAAVVAGVHTESGTLVLDINGISQPLDTIISVTKTPAI